MRRRYPSDFGKRKPPGRCGGDECEEGGECEEGIVSRTRCIALLRRAGTHKRSGTWTPDQQRTASALRCIRGTLTPASAADIGADDVAEQVPLLAVEFHQLKLADRREIIRAGIDLDAGQQDFGPEILQVSRLLHDVFASEIVAAHLKNLHQGLRDAETD